MKRTIYKMSFAFIVIGVLALAFSTQALEAGMVKPLYEHPGRVIDLYGGANNNGYGPGYLGPFPSPHGGQGQDHWMDMVFPQSEVALYTGLYYDYWPLSSKMVQLEINGPYDKLPNGTIVKKPNWQIWGRFTVITNDTGLAKFSFRMPWPLENPDAITGIWQTTATAEVQNVTITDTMLFYYQRLVHITSATTDKYAYTYGEYVTTTVTYETHATQDYPALFSVTLKSQSGEPFGLALVSKTIGGATFCTWKVDTFDTSILIPYQPSLAGIAHAHVNCYDKDPSIGGFAWCPEYSPPPEFAIAYIVVPDQYASIQAAINAANDGDTVFVKAGTYHEHSNIWSMIIVNKSISLVGEGKSTTILEGNYEFTPIIAVEANNVTITGFTIQHSANVMGLLGGGVCVSGADNSRIIGNIIINTQYCVNLYMNTTGNLVVDNVLAILGDYYGNGIQCLQSSGNMIYHNTFINSHGPVFHASSEGYSNIWDNGYPDGGNYWQGYTGADLFSGPYQNVTGSDYIGDTPYVIDVINQDRYPLMRATDPLEGDINLDGKVDLKDVFAVAKAYGSHPGDPNWNVMCDINSDMKVDLKDYFATCKNYGKQW